MINHIFTTFHHSARLDGVLVLSYQRDGPMMVRLGDGAIGGMSSVLIKIPYLQGTKVQWLFFSSRPLPGPVFTYNQSTNLQLTCSSSRDIGGSITPHASRALIPWFWGQLMQCKHNSSTRLFLCAPIPLWCRTVVRGRGGERGEEDHQN